MSTDDTDARSMLVDILEKGDFPDESFEKRHIERIDEFERVAPNKFRFSVRRHPHLFGHKTLGRPSSAYAIVKDIFELDTQRKKVDPISSETESVEIDYEMLAEDYVDSLMEADTFDFDAFGSVAEVTKAVEDDTRNSAWDNVFTTDYELPADFVEQFVLCYVEEVVQQWELHRELG